MSQINLVHRKLQYLYFLLLSSTSLFSQVPIGITTSVGDQINLSICDGDTVTFTLDPVSGTSAGYKFYRITGGVTMYVQSNSPSNTYTTSSILDGDIFYGERYDYDFSSTPIITDQITFAVLTVSGPPFTGGTIDQPSQFSCPGLPGLNLTVSGGATGIDYLFQWQKADDNSSPFQDIPGATGATFNTGVVTQTTFFRRQTMHNGGGTCEKFSTVLVYQVSDLSPGSLDTNSNQSICYDSNPGTLGLGSSTFATATHGSISYQWEQNINGAGWIAIPGETGTTYTPPSLTSDVQFRRFAVNTTSLGSCQFSTNIISIAVAPQIIPGTSTGQQSICNGDVPSTLQLTGATSGADIIHQWQSSTDGINFNDIPGATGVQLTFTASTTYNPVFTTYYRVKTGTVTPSCEVFSSVTTLTVLPENVNLTSSAVNGVYCSGDDIEFTVTGDSSTFSFYLDGFPLLINSSSPTYTISNLTGDHLLTFSAVTLSGCNRQIDLNLKENNIDAGTISGDQLVCTGINTQEITSLISGTSRGIDIDLVSTATYQWQSSIDGHSWNNLVGANSKNYTPPSSIPQSIYLRRAVSNTISGVSCLDFSNTVYVEKVSSIDGGIIMPSSQSLCTSSTVVPLVVSGSTSSTNIAYQWESAVYPGGSFSSIPSATQPNYTPSIPTVSMQYRRLTFSTTSSACSAYSNVHEIHPIDLDPGSLDPSQSTSVFQNTSPGSLGNGITGSSAHSNNASITYQWEMSTSSGAVWNDISGATGLEYTPPGLTQNTQFRRRAIGTIAGNTCDAVTNAINIFISSLLVGGTIAQDQMLCNTLLPNDLVLTGATSGSNIVYEWQMTTDNISYFTISNTTNRLSFTTTSTWKPVQDVTYYRVKVVDHNSGNTAYSNTVSITLLPVNVSLTSDASSNVFCEGDNVTLTASGTGSLTYAFYVNGILYQGPGASTTYVHNFTDTATVTLYATNGTGCSKREDLVLTANLVNAGTISGTQTICKGETPNSILSLIEGTALGTNFQSSTSGS